LLFIVCKSFWPKHFGNLNAIRVRMVNKQF
jgi:hypothetical protein